MSIKSFIRSKMAAWLDDGAQTDAPASRVKSGPSGDLTVEASSWGRRASFAGIHQVGVAQLLTGDLNVNAERLVKMVDAIAPSEWTSHISARYTWREIAEQLCKQRDGGGAAISFQSLVEAVKSYSAEDAPSAHALASGAQAHMLPIVQALEFLRVSFDPVNVGVRAVLHVSIDGKSLVAKAGDAEALAVEYRTWEKRLHVLTKAGGTLRKPQGWSGVLKFACVCGVLFAGLYAYGAFLQARGVAPVAAVGAAAPTVALSGVVGGGAPGGLRAVTEEEMRKKAYGAHYQEGPATYETRVTGTIDDNKIASIESLTPEKLKKIQTAHALVMRTSGEMVYSFSNPTCSACRHLEGELHKLQPDANPVVIPVAFDEQSMRIGTAIMCSPDPVAAWRTIMSGETISTPLCAEGLKKMETNSLLFGELGFNATPTIVSNDGRAMVGSVATAALGAWMKGVQ